MAAKIHYMSCTPHIEARRLVYSALCAQFKCTYYVGDVHDVSLLMKIKGKTM